MGGSFYWARVSRPSILISIKACFHEIQNCISATFGSKTTIESLTALGSQFTSMLPRSSDDDDDDDDDDDEEECHGSDKASTTYPHTF